MYPVLCKDCIFSQPDKNSGLELRCHNPKVNGKDPWALGGAHTFGTSCHNERSKKWFVPCGMKGKLWEQKDAK